MNKAGGGGAGVNDCFCWRIGGGATGGL